MSTTAEAFVPRVSHYTIQPVIPLDRAFLNECMRIAIDNPECLCAWAVINKQALELDRPPICVDIVVWAQEKEWPEGTPLRIDINTLQRGLYKVFDTNQALSIPTRQLVLKALFEQAARPTVFEVAPRVLSDVIQLAVFDQVVY